jgi:glyoxylase I family protein
MCSKVEDVWAKKAELEAEGVEVYGGVNVVGDGPLAGCRWVYFSDPDGLALELMQLASFPVEERKRAIAEYLASRPQVQPVS